MTSYATGLTNDFDAVDAGLSLPHNSGVIEGRVTDLKLIKRHGRPRPYPAPTQPGHPRRALPALQQARTDHRRPLGDQRSRKSCMSPFFSE
ncbi:hypothetical protein [Actinacidiphila soli]|uniref:hypothetical protein n=1 Tax=Actinacidiphila soli TaxID=2487275 RepID=UPI000FCADD27|nr:hypothetical protein [Actinacidiphila soli]